MYVRGRARRPPWLTHTRHACKSTRKRSNVRRESAQDIPSPTGGKKKNKQTRREREAGRSHRNANMTLGVRAFVTRNLSRISDILSMTRSVVVGDRLQFVRSLADGCWLGSLPACAQHTRHGLPTGFVAEEAAKESI